MTDMLKKFRPKPDLTVQELAEIVAHLPLPGINQVSSLCTGLLFTDGVWSETPDNIKRHFIDG